MCWKVSYRQHGIWKMNWKRKPQELFICNAPFHLAIGHRLNETLSLVSGTPPPQPATLELTLSRGKENVKFGETGGRKHLSNIKIIFFLFGTSCSHHPTSSRTQTDIITKGASNNSTQAGGKYGNTPFGVVWTKNFRV